MNLKKRYLMRLKKLWIDGFKNLNNFTIDFESIKGKFKKPKFAKECQEEEFDKTNFDGFKKLFDLILEIKTNNSKK